MTVHEFETWLITQGYAEYWRFKGFKGGYDNRTWFRRGPHPTYYVCLPAADHATYALRLRQDGGMDCVMGMVFETPEALLAELTALELTGELSAPGVLSWRTERRCRQ